MVYEDALINYFECGICEEEVDHTEIKHFTINLENDLFTSLPAMEGVYGLCKECQEEYKEVIESVVVK